MPFRQEIKFLRDRARRLREMAEAHRTALSDQLRGMAAELEARADELQRQPDREDGPSRRQHRSDRTPNGRLVSKKGSRYADVRCVVGQVHSTCSYLAEWAMPEN